jgi:hypothetical protein
VRDKLGGRYEPHPALESVFGALEELGDYELNLLVGQIVLEGTSASLLWSLCAGVGEPLLRGLLQRILRDEARHIRFAGACASVARPSTRRRRVMQEVLYRAAFAGAASLLATDVWQELGLGLVQCRSVAVDELARRGVLRFYTRVITRQLARRGFPTDELARRLERRLEVELRAA